MALFRQCAYGTVGWLVSAALVWADTGTSSTTLTVDPSASSGTVISASDENDRNNDVTTWANAHVHTLGNSLSWGDGTAGNKDLCANAADATDRCIRWNDTADLWTLQQPSTDFNGILVSSGTVGLTSGGILYGNGTAAAIATNVMTNGQLLIGDGSGPPTLGTLTAGAGVTVTNGAGTITVAAASSTVSSFTRDSSTASGTAAYTGVGFTPRTVVFFCTDDNAAGEASWGMDNGTTRRCLADDNANSAGTYTTSTTDSIFHTQSAGNTYAGRITSLDSDGFTITWTRTGTPTGDINCTFTAMR